VSGGAASAASTKHHGEAAQGRARLEPPEASAGDVLPMADKVLRRVAEPGRLGAGEAGGCFEGPANIPCFLDAGKEWL